jgi:SprT protein
MKKLSESDMALLKSRGKVTSGFTTTRSDGFVNTSSNTCFVKSDKNTIIDEVHKVYDKARSVFGREFDLPHIKFSKRGKVAGTANYSRNELNFNMVLFKENKDDFLKTTIPHECCHLFARTLYRHITPHGRQWKSCMLTLGYNPNRCHKYNVTNSTVFHKGKYVYKCSCFVLHTVSIVRHRKMNRGIVYRCSRCKGVLIFEKYAGKVSHEDAIKGL